MELEKAKKYLDILSENINKIKSGKGLQISKFVILPLDYMNEKGLAIDGYKIMENTSKYQRTFNDKWSYKIVGIIRPQYSVISFDYNSERFARIAENKDFN